MYSINLSFGRPKNVLTTREEEVLIEVVKGLNNYEIADELLISTHTAKFYVASILHKFGVTRRSGIIIKALTDGWVDIIQRC
ncbi:response regulator transcription factor [bacterium]|nr:response regulator transcription factor [bacterium]